MPVNNYFAGNPTWSWAASSAPAPCGRAEEINVKLDKPERLAEMLDQAVGRLPSRAEKGWAAGRWRDHAVSLSVINGYPAIFGVVAYRHHPADPKTLDCGVDQPTLRQ
jgi:hypothetical protein